jgi:hypothetical protein
MEKIFWTPNIHDNMTALVIRLLPEGKSAPEAS